MSLRRSARQSGTLVTKTNGPSYSASSATNKRANGEDESPPTQPKRVKKTLPRNASGTESTAFKVPPVPITPVRKRSTKAMQPPHLTPTPSLVGLMRTPYSSGDIDDVTPPPSESIKESSLPTNPIILLLPAWLQSLYVVTPNSPAAPFDSSSSAVSSFNVIVGLLFGILVISTGSKKSLTIPR